MSKADKKFLWYAMLAVFVLLTVILGVINIVNFTMAASDADALTSRIAEQHGTLNAQGDKNGKKNPPGSQAQDADKGFRPGVMGPDSPEMNNSLRFFTVAYPKGSDTGELIEYRMSAISESGALELADRLKSEDIGWTNVIYRYRVYTEGGRTFVTVVDQGRELHTSYRILIISAVGWAAGLILSYIFLSLIRKKIFAPINDADRKQKQFISSAEEEFRMPLTVISAQNELLEKEHGMSEETASIRKQVGNMGRVIKKLSNLAIYEDDAENRADVDLSGLLDERLERKAQKFAERGIRITKEIEENITLKCDADGMKKAFDELVTNSLKYSLTECGIRMTRANDRITVVFTNDADLDDGPCDIVFDRFTTLKNAAGTDPGTGQRNDGLGLAYVKDIIKSHGGRVSAKVEKGTFRLTIAL